MRGVPDLDDAITSLDWADRQIGVLSGEFAAFAATNPYTISSDHRSDGWTDIYVSSTEPITKRFAPSVNAIIQAQRSALDYLAVALAVANGSTNTKNTYFVVTQTQEGLTEPGSLKKLSALDPADQKLLLDLKPYRGGNDTLFALHSLNIERKHNRLGMLAGNVNMTRFGGGPIGGALGGLIAYAPTILAKEPHLMASAMFQGEIQFGLMTDIAFRDVPGPQASPLVIPTLYEFSGACRKIVALFG